MSASLRGGGREHTICGFEKNKLQIVQTSPKTLFWFVKLKLTENMFHLYLILFGGNISKCATAVAFLSWLNTLLFTHPSHWKCFLFVKDSFKIYLQWYNLHIIFMSAVAFFIDYQFSGAILLHDIAVKSNALSIISLPLSQIF